MGNRVSEWGDGCGPSCTFGTGVVTPRCPGGIVAGCTGGLSIRLGLPGVVVGGLMKMAGGPGCPSWMVGEMVVTPSGGGSETLRTEVSSPKDAGGVVGMLVYVAD